MEHKRTDVNAATMDGLAVDGDPPLAVTLSLSTSACAGLLPVIGGSLPQARLGTTSEGEVGATVVGS